MFITIVAAAAVLASTHRWEVDYGATECRLSRAYGADDAPVVLSLKGLNTSSKMLTLDLVVPAAGRKSAERGQALITFAPNGRSERPSFVSYVADGEDRRAFEVFLPVERPLDLTEVKELRVVGGSVDVALAPAITHAAINAYEKCSSDLMASWGLDPSEPSRIATPAEPINVAQWYSQDDYPADALKYRKAGNVIITYAISEDGSVENCRVVSSSGTTSLDEAACQLLAKRARYKPAIGKDGKPVQSHTYHSVSWRLPG